MACVYCVVLRLLRPFRLAVLYFHNALGKIFLDRLAGCVRIEWQTAPMISVDLRAVYEHTLHLLKREGLTKVLSDHRFMPPFTAADREWLTGNWIPRAIEQAKYSHCAIVQANIQANHVATQHMTSLVGGENFQVEHFTEPAQASAWLLAQ